MVKEYKAELMHPYYAAERGLVDDVIDPAETREVLIRSLAMLRTKHADLPVAQARQPPAVTEHWIAGTRRTCGANAGEADRFAAETFCREGFRGGVLSVISAQAGVSSGALHFHFAGKAALADAVESAALDRLRIIAGVASREGAGRLQCLVDVTHGLALGLRGDVVLRAGFGLGRDTARVTPGGLR